MEPAQRVTAMTTGKRHGDQRGLWTANEFHFKEELIETGEREKAAIGRSTTEPQAMESQTLLFLGKCLIACSHCSE